MIDRKEKPEKIVGGIFRHKQIQCFANKDKNPISTFSGAMLGLVFGSSGYRHFSLVLNRFAFPVIDNNSRCFVTGNHLFVVEKTFNHIVEKGEPVVQ
jgi:hypothetical protein